MILICLYKFANVYVCMYVYMYVCMFVCMFISIGLFLLNCNDSIYPVQGKFIVSACHELYICV